MTVGDTSIFAIESRISITYESPSLRGLGLFVIHIGERRYGVYEDDATVLACSFDEVGRRKSHRGNHTAPFAEEDSRSIATSVLQAIYTECSTCDTFFGFSQAGFTELVYSHQLLWAPDGDEAFDDRSFVLQFDIGPNVRLIAFQRNDGDSYDPATLTDVLLPSNSFYSILDGWYNQFDAEWRMLVSSGDGNMGRDSESGELR